jgi:hypothetical protein
MPKPEPTSNSRSSRPLVSLPRFQFSLFWLMIVVTLVAVILGLGWSLGSLFLDVIFLAVCCVVPTPLVICVVFGRGYLRAFAIGALIPWIILIPWGSRSATLIILALTVVLSGTCGLIAAGTWRWIRQTDAT